MNRVLAALAIITVIGWAVLLGCAVADLDHAHHQAPAPGGR